MTDHERDAIEQAQQILPAESTGYRVPATGEYITMYRPQQENICGIWLTAAQYVHLASIQNR